MFTDIPSLSDEPKTEIMAQTADVLTLPPWGPYHLPRAVLRADKMTVEEIAKYIFEMTQGRWDSIGAAFREFEDYRYPIGGPIFPFWVHREQENGLRLELDNSFWYRSPHEMEKIVQAISQISPHRLSIKMRLDDTPVVPNLKLEDLIVLTDALRGSNIHSLHLASPINMLDENWDALHTFAEILGHSEIREFTWCGMTGLNFSRDKAATIFKEHLTEQQWTSFGSNLRYR